MTLIINCRCALHARSKTKNYKTGNVYRHIKTLPLLQMTANSNYNLHRFIFPYIQLRHNFPSNLCRLAHENLNFGRMFYSSNSNHSAFLNLSRLGLLHGEVILLHHFRWYLKFLPSKIHLLHILILLCFDSIAILDFSAVCFNWSEKK